jgi:DNA-binding IclR family transcriptional regulator
VARPAPGADRLVAVLELLARHPDERFTLSEVARQCSLNKATAHALLTTLSERGVLLRHPEEKRYSLGPRLVAIGEAARRGYTAVDFAPAVLHALVQAARLAGRATRVVARAWQIDGDQVVCVGQAGGGRSMHVPLRLPLIPPVGLVFMAWSDPTSVETWLARAGAVDAMAPAVEALPAVRRQGFVVMQASPEWLSLTRAPPDRPGWPAEDGAGEGAQRDLLRTVARQPLVVGAVDRSGVYRPAEVSAPVFDARGEVALALSVSGMAGETVAGTELGELGRRVAAAGDGLTSSVGGHRPTLAT